MHDGKATHDRIMKGDFVMLTCLAKVWNLTCLIRDYFEQFFSNGASWFSDLHSISIVIIVVIFYRKVCDFSDTVSGYSPCCIGI